jgi:glycosyltransferase involved in cell wall biosynthesis
MKAPIWVSQLELTEPVPSLDVPLTSPDGDAYTGARVLVRLDHLPIGYVEIESTRIDPPAFARAIWNQLAPAINERLRRNGLSEIKRLTKLGLPRLAGAVRGTSSQPFISVVLCTRNRTEGAMQTIRDLANLDYADYEVIVVDNAPGDESTRDAVLAEFGDSTVVRYVREDNKGLSRARNRGVREACGEFIAFTDDDVFVDRWWLQGIAKGFATLVNVGCVTGFIPSASLDNDVQLYFDRRVTWGSSCETRVFDVDSNRDKSPLYPYSPGIFGTGANFAMRRSVLDQLDGFDNALGAGAPCGGGEDLDIFMRTVLAGYALVYEPSAIISHIHRAEIDELRKQMFAYGSGFSASLMSLILRRPRTVLSLAKRALFGIARFRTIANRNGEEGSLPADLIARELRGMVYGPVQYFEGRLRAKPAKPDTTAPPPRIRNVA